MKTLLLRVSDEEYDEIDARSGEVSLPELKRLLLANMFRESQERLIASAEAAGLSEMTMDEITEIVKEVRRDAKNSRGY